MERSFAALVALIAGILALSSSALAHHGTAAFDTSQMVTVEGTVTDFVYLNPHVQVYFEIKNRQSETEKWQGELTAPNKLNRAGWNKYTLKASDEITVSGNPSKDHPHTLWIRKLIGPDGTSLPLFEE
jgi:Family of unknown function (DUF6152)